MTTPWLWVIGGPNGVGKTTYARAHLRQVADTIHFVNADELARGLSPLDPTAASLDAARLVFVRARQHRTRRETFAFESTLSGRTHLRLMAGAKAEGYRLGLLYFWVADMNVTLARIARRVAEGGHNVPHADVARRWPRSIHGFRRAATATDLWRLFDATARPRVVAEGSGTDLSYQGDNMPPAFAPLIAGFRPQGE